MENWHLGDSGMVSAHEFGHMLGLFDEYWGGAVDDTVNPLLDSGALMGSVSQDAKMRDRYYQQYLDFVKELNPNPQYGFQLSEVPEPSQIAMMFTIAVLGGLACRRGRSAVRVRGEG